MADVKTKVQELDMGQLDEVAGGANNNNSQSTSYVPHFCPSCNKKMILKPGTDDTYYCPRCNPKGL